MVHVERAVSCETPLTPTVAAHNFMPPSVPDHRRLPANTGIELSMVEPSVQHDDDEDYRRAIAASLEEVPAAALNHPTPAHPAGQTRALAAEPIVSPHAAQQSFAPPTPQLPQGWSAHWSNEHSRCRSSPALIGVTSCEEEICRYFYCDSSQVSHWELP